MNNRMMSFGAAMYDAWWIMVAALAIVGGVGWVLQSVWWAWLAWVFVSGGVGWFGAGAMVGWHERCEARRQQAEDRFWEESFAAGEARWRKAVGDTGISADGAERALRKWIGGDDGEQ